ncbi:MAG: hypothetical protein GVY12_08885 [Bacteroidetes bacterium]|jgi:hypothetical protein|nr:hypothetical protein [Bacteroidota bacterium]
MPRFFPVLLLALLVGGCASIAPLEVPELRPITDELIAEVNPHEVAHEMPDYAGPEGQLTGRAARYAAGTSCEGKSVDLIVQFVLSTDGTVLGTRAIDRRDSAVTLGSCKAAARASVQDSEWTPGRIDGEPVPIIVGWTVRW